MNRRSGTRLWRLIGMMLVLALGLAACGPDDAEPELGGTDTEAPDGDDGTADGETDEPTAAGGTLNIGVRDDVQRWDSSRVQTILFPFTRALYDPLIEYDENLEPVPALATDWQIADDNSSVTITLRDDVVFHSGRAMTAEDVAANLEVFADSELGNQLFGPMAVVESWEATDDVTLEVVFTQPLAELQITDLMQSWLIGDPEAFDQYDSRGEGTGPFKFVEWVPGESVVFEANTDYWGEGPLVDELNYRIFGDDDSMISAFESGVVDVVWGPQAIDAERLAGDNNVVEGYPGALIDGWRINPTVPPFDNPNIRQAINYANDRETITESLYRGFAQPLTQPFAPASPAFDEELEQELAFDPERARQLIEESGLSGDELSMTMLVNAPAADSQMASQILQAQLQELGMTVELELRDSGEYTEKLLAGDFGILFSAIGNAQKYPTRITTNSIYRTEDNPVNALEACPAYEPAVEAAQSAVSEQEQEEAFAELNRVLADCMWVVTVGTRPTLVVTASAVSGVERNVDNMTLWHRASIDG